MPICEVCGLEYCTAGGSKKHIGCPGKKTESVERRAENEERKTENKDTEKKIGKKGEVESIGKTTADMGEKEFKKDGIEGKK